jgi:hypothetical protein
MVLLAYAFILLALVTGGIGYFAGQRYVDARALETGQAPHQARAGSTEIGGTTPFEDRMNLEVLLGNFGGSRNPETLALGKKARAWSYTSASLAIFAISILAVNQWLS